MAACAHSRTADGVRLCVRLTPKAGRDAIEGLKPTAEGGFELAVRVTAVPEKGKANAALLKLLAKALKIPAGRMCIVAGETDRHKQILIAGEPAAVEAQLQSQLSPWCDALDRKG
ncbi:MAG TPA: DUF167 family protein [Ferrovibrio sp.]|uniref:DUF167 family protein n=1 Tax=Ferrovibrio sp. TaxID=1917215 RepID=UPI002ED12549